MDSGISSLKVFVSYSHDDEEHKETFRQQLIDLTRGGEIDLWDDRQLSPGDAWLQQIRERVESCDIAVLLVSSNFLDSDFIFSEEWGRLLKRWKAGNVQMFPIILRPCRWKASEIADLQVLPKDGLPVVSFSTENGARDQAWADVGDAFADVVQDMKTAPAPVQQVTAEPAQPAPVKTEPASPFADKYNTILRALDLGRVAVFLGEGVNRPDPSVYSGWQHGNPDTPPLNGEIAQFIAENNSLPIDADACLAEVAQRVAVRDGIAPIYSDLHDLLNLDYAINDIHRAMAQLPGALRASGRTDPNPIFITVNYDDLTERAFAEIGEPLDVLAYSVDQNNRGIFSHISPDNETKLLKRPNENSEFSLGEHERPLLLKLAGTVDRAESGIEHFVVTEDDHFSYVVDRDIKQLLPPALKTRLFRCHYLFLGHSLSHWTLRSILSRVFGHGRLPARSWVVDQTNDEQDRDFWTYRNAELIQAPLPEFANGLVSWIGESSSWKRS